MKIIRGKQQKAKKVLVYGPEGIGKTTFASKFPDPLFVDTEGSTAEYDVARTEKILSWSHLKSIVQEIANERPAQTLVIDTLDWAEKMCVKSVCDAHQWESITDPGYGNGYTHVFNEFGKLLNLLTEAVDNGINVVLTAHAALRKFEQPDERGAYDRWALKLIDTPKCSIAHLVMEWADMILFANYKTIVITDAKTKKTKAQGGQRVMYTAHHSCWDAKNRFGLPEELPFDYGQIRSVIEGAGTEQPKAAPPAPASAKPVREPEEPAKPADPAPAPTPAKDEDYPFKKIWDEHPVKEEELDKRIPKALRDLMLKDNITDWDIENYVMARGYAPPDTKIWDLESVNPGIIDGLLVAQWTGVRDVIRQMQKELEIPFN